MSILGDICFYSPYNLSDAKCKEIAKKCTSMMESWKCTYDSCSECIMFDYLGEYQTRNMIEKISELALSMKILRENGFFSESNLIYDFFGYSYIIKFFIDKNQCVEIISTQTINKITKITTKIINLDNSEEKIHQFEYER